MAVPARAESSPVLRSALREFLEQLSLSRERVADVVLAVGEATSNAIEHAYRGHDGTVWLRAVEDPPGRLIIEVVDQGRWRLDASPERGRGLGIMRALVDDVAIESTREGTLVRFEVLF
ncbi:MAG TPA: ATP-binding protein [Candidatus Acidoferrales bacterium]|nr:ATP-binding protein [Candidatus Acidoferrales bacterium]